MIIDHLGIAVDDIEKAIAFYREAAGLSVVHQETVESQGVRTVFLADASGGTAIELLEPTDGSGPVADFLAKRGPGLHHLAFLASGVAAEMSRMAAAGRPALGESPRLGARGHHVCFFHPKHSGGVLLEFVGGA